MDNDKELKKELGDANVADTKSSKAVELPDDFKEFDGVEKEQHKDMLSEFTFDFQDMEHLPSIIVSGRRHAGKNVFINELVYHLDQRFKFERIFCFSQTASFNDSMHFIRKEDIFDTMDNLKKIVEIRKQTLSKKPVLIICDDVQGMTEISSRTGKPRAFKNSEQLEVLFTLARHYSISVLVSVQRAKSMCSKLMRSNADITVLFTSSSHDEMYSLKQEYLGLCKSKQEQNAIFDSVFSKPFCCMVVESWRSGIVSTHEYCKRCIAPYPVRKYKCRYVSKMKRKKKKQDKMKQEAEEKKSRIYSINEAHSFRIRNGLEFKAYDEEQQRFQESKY